jgi:hypothetical protein
MKLKILIVEDEGPIGDLLQAAITTRLNGLQHEVIVRRCPSIPQSKSALEDFRPHIVTLDLKDDSTDDMSSGKPAWEFIRDKHFCPVVFFSANDLPEGFPDGTDPFAKYLNKNAKSEIDVAATIVDFIPHVVGLDQLRSEVESRYAKSLQKVSGLIWKAEGEPQARNEALLRVTRRRLAATLEHPLGEELHIKAWEQFIYPPIDEHLCTGDVILQRNADRTMANSFRVILTPPCDLVPGQNAVTDVLLGQCFPISHAEVFRRAGLPAQVAPTARLADKLVKDEVGGMKIIPKLSDLWPTMVLDFKSLELAPRTVIALLPETANEESKFERIASMDSPFREALSWRFMQTAGRPGTPDADRTALDSEIKAAT